MKLSARRQEFLSFAFVGAAAAVVDAGVLFLAIHMLSLDPYAGRVISYLAAATFAWAVNRWMTFRSAERGGLAWQWLRYLVTGVAGGLVNYAVYAALVAASGRLVLPPLIYLLAPYAAVGCGSLAGLLLNFTLVRRVVFQPQPTPAP